ncbi:MAG: hydantoinase B/oxoprolinase family protein [Deltaproteobacteria bacterium]
MRYAFWVDRGGTFTDCILHDRETGRLAAIKVLSSDRAPLVGIRQLLGLAPDEPIPPSEIRMGTTLATNALLERRGVPCALVITRGFRDLLEIGNQTRPHLFDLKIPPPERLYRRVLEIETRAAPDGGELSREPLARLRQGLEELRAAGIESLAVVVLHAYAGGALELEIRDAARAVGFEHVALSHEVAPQIGLLARAATSVLDAYLTPLLASYLTGLQRDLPGCRLWLMQSSGGLSLPQGFRAQHSFLSGPAGGVVAAAQVVREAGLTRAISFDMGGTSTDVSRYAGEYERVYERNIAGLEVLAPMLDIHTVAAGGGSICSFDGSRFQVGPESAGAAPGPLCYGDPTARALTVTDLNLFLGRLQPELFPLPLTLAPVQRALEQMQAHLAENGQEQSLERIAQGMLSIANANMAEAIARVSVARGYDVRDHALVVFGGAGGQHACSVAELLGIESILFHPLAGVLSAYGMGLAPITRHAQADAGRARLCAELLEQLEAVYSELEGRVREALEAEGIAAQRAHVRRSVGLGYAGSETVLTLPLASAERLREDFELQHQRLFGYRRAQHPILVVQLRVEGSTAPDVGSPRDTGSSSELAPPEPPSAQRSARFWSGFDAAAVSAPVFTRSELLPGHELPGPAIVLDSTGSIVVDRGFRLRVAGGGLLHVTRELAAQPARSSAAHLLEPDPVQLELMGNRFMAIAQQMGEVLRRTAISTNIRERLDFSCALFDRQAALIANAPHIPVHLGAMGESVAAVHAQHPEPAPGDVFIINDPAHGGSHLPDITVVTPVHAANGRLQFYVASRGHHADVGGSSPGSMPANSQRLAEEGVVFRGEKIVSQGKFARETVLTLLAQGPYPARMPADNLADLEAQIAANRRGVELLSGLTRELGDAFVERYMSFILDYAERQVQALLRSLPAGTYRCSDRLDDGSLLQLQLHVADGRLRVDFRGTAGEHPGNLNAPRAVTLSAILYVLRCLVPRSIPLNAGCLRPVELLLPEPSLLAPGPDRAVAAGNVETSQRVVDVLLGAFDRLAASQGTMNNLTFGNASFGYYETLAGGAGAGPGFPGASAVHTHMTNTRITDVEVLEARYPVRVLEFSVRRGSGGRGRWPGGDGLVRELEFLAPLEVSIVSERRSTLPFGLCGGHSAEPGRNLLNGTPLPGRAQFSVTVGDRLRIETPGGGGYGAP